MDYLIYSIEDDVDIAHIINVTLSKQGFEVKTFFDALSFYHAFKEKKPNLILLDMMLPDISGQEVLKEIRKESSNDEIPIIIISANNMVIDKVDGLDLGADDYIEKPFDLLELMSRVNVWVRKHKKSKMVMVKDVAIDVDKRECLKDGKSIELTEKEFDILLMLFQKQGGVLSREEILNKIWGANSILETRTIDMHIKSLRNKLDDDGSFIKTVYGIGYKVSL